MVDADRWDPADLSPTRALSRRQPALFQAYPLKSAVLHLEQICNPCLRLEQTHIRLNGAL